MLDHSVLALLFCLTVVMAGDDKDLSDEQVERSADEVKESNLKWLDNEKVRISATATRKSRQSEHGRSQ